MLQATKEQPHAGAVLFGGEGVLPLAACGVYPKTRVWGSNEKMLHNYSATARLRIELRWGCEESSEKTAVGSGDSLKYDPFGRRIYKQSPNATSIFAYDGPNLIETVNATGGVVAHYTQSPNIDEPLAMQRGTTTDYYEADGLGSVTSLTDSTGAVAQGYTYDSFGNLTNSTGTLRNYFRYTAREFDTETNLYYYRARYYDQSVGRFISEDPKGFDGGVDFYRYVSNNVTDKVDPFGFAPCWDKLTITGVASCSAQFVSAKGITCRGGDPPGAVQSLCSDIQKAIQKDKSDEFPAYPCPSGQCCKNMQPQTTVQLNNQEFTVKKKGCTVVFRLTGVFTVNGNAGTCSQ
jgi:RHS repeat-associated protein